MEQGRGARLDQSGMTYLPAREFTCPEHVDVVTALPTGEPYRSAFHPKEEAPCSSSGSSSPP